MKPICLPGVNVTTVKKKRWNLDKLFFYLSGISSLFLTVCITINVIAFIQKPTKWWVLIFSTGSMCPVLYMNFRDFLKNFRKKRAMKRDGISYCNECNGRGLIQYKEVLNIEQPGSVFKERSVTKRKFFDVCNKCGGTGKVDWVRRVMSEEEI